MIEMEKAPTKIAILIRLSPFNSVIATEALRMGLGLTLSDNKVTVAFLEDGVYLPVSSAADGAGFPDVIRHIETLKEMGCRLVVEKDSLEKRGLLDRKIDVEIVTRRGIDKIIAGSDRVIGF